MTIYDIMFDKQAFANFFKFYKNTEEQAAGVELLRQAIAQSDPGLLTDSAEWVVKYREQPKTPSTPKLTPSSSYSQLVTPNFSYGELTLNDPRRRFTNQGQCDIAVELCQFLEKARAKFGPIKITSGHRPPDINASVGGASNSEHLFNTGCGAVDVYPLNGNGSAFEKWVDENWLYSVGYGMSYRGFVHVGIRAGRPRVRWNY